MPDRQDGTPVLIDQNGNYQKLSRLSLQGRRVKEAWLQERLAQCPSLLPVDEIDPGFGPLISIGREVATAAGPIDNLFVSPEGTITLVEAKLWRNPEARRQVVGQILDYAKELSQWTYDDLDQKSHQVAGKSLWALVSDASPAVMDEARFVDQVVRNLKAGRFLLLIVGDGIREEMEQLTDFLQSSPQLRFTLALVELHVFELQDQYLVMPVIVGRTREITRGVVRVISSGTAPVAVSVDIDNADDVATEKKRRRALTESEYFSVLAESGMADHELAVARNLYDRFVEDTRFEVVLGAASYTIKVCDPIERNWLYTVLVVTKSGSAYVGWLDGQLPRADLAVEIGEEFVGNLAQLLGVRVSPANATGWSGNAHLAALAAKYDEVVALIDTFATTIHTRRLEQNAADEEEAT